MISQLSQETVTEYASEALTIQEPQGADYTKGVSVGKTIPAKWWNWLFNAVTKRASQSKTDAQNMLDEIKNVVTDAGLTPDASDSTQMAQAVVAKADAEIDKYVYNKQGFFADWMTVSTPPVPAGHTLGTRVSIDGSVAYRITRQSSTMTNSFTITINSTGATWGPVATVNLLQYVHSGYSMQTSLCVFKGRYFLLYGGLQDAAYQTESHFELFVSDNGVEWSRLRTIHIHYSNDNVNHIYPSMGLGADRLYFITYEGADGNFSSYLLATEDGRTITELASGFAHVVSPQDGMVIPYGSNGFAWGEFIYDGSTLTTAFTPLRNDAVQKVPNPVVFRSGVALYKMARGGNVIYKAPSLGAVAERFTGMPNYSFWFMTPDKEHMVGVNAPSQGYACTSVQLMDDTLTAVDMPQPPNTSSTLYRPFVQDGVAYCYRHKSTDCINWTELSGLPPALSATDCIIPCLPSGVFRFFRYQADTGFISTNNGVTWRETTFNRSDLLGSMFNHNCCFDIRGSVTFTSINRVIGHTLYLR